MKKPKKISNILEGHKTISDVPYSRNDKYEDEPLEEEDEEEEEEKELPPVDLDKKYRLFIQKSMKINLREY